MAADNTTLLAIVAGPVLTAAVTVWVPAWLQRRTEKQRFTMEETRLDIEAERAHNERTATTAAKRDRETLDLSTAIVEQIGRMIGSNNEAEVGKLRALISRGELELPNIASDVCRRWRAEFNAKGFSQTAHQDFVSEMTKVVRLQLDL